MTLALAYEAYLLLCSFHEPGGARLRRALISVFGRSGLDGVSPHRNGFPFPEPECSRLLQPAGWSDFPTARTNVGLDARRTINHFRSKIYFGFASPPTAMSSFNFFGG